MPPEIAQIIQMYMGGNISGAGLGPAGPYGGQGDLFGSTLGLTSSAAPPSVFNTGMMDRIREMRMDFVRSGRDQSINDLASLTGMNKSVIATLANAVPGASNFISSGADVMGGSLMFAQAINPLIGSTMDVEQRGLKNYETFNNKLIETVQGRIRGENGPAYQGIASGADAGAILAFATNRGIINTNGFQRDETTGQMRKVNAGDMVKRSTEVLDNFDELMKAGRDVFGPNAKAQDILMRAEQMGGSMRSPADLKRASSDMVIMRNLAFITGGSAEGAFQAQIRMSQQLQNMGISSHIAGRLSTDATFTAMKQYDQSAEAFGALGIHGDRVSFETRQSVNAQNAARTMSSRKAKIELARKISEERGWSTDAKSLGALVDRMDPYGGIESMATGEQVAAVIEQFDTSATDISKQRFDNNLRAGLVEGVNRDAIEAFRAARFDGKGTKGIRQMRAIRDATQSGDWATVEEMIGTKLSAKDREFLEKTAAQTAQEIAADPASRLTSAEREELEALSGAADPTKKGTMAERLARAFEVQKGQKNLDFLKGKFGDKVSKVDSTDDLSGLSADQLMERNMIKVRREGVAEGEGYDYYKVNAKGEEVSDALQTIKEGGGLGGTDISLEDIGIVLKEFLTALIEQLRYLKTEDT
jgi:hypothetical protein